MTRGFRDQYFSFLMEGTVEQFRAAAESLTTALSYGTTLEEAQGIMDAARTDAELLCLLVETQTMHGVGDG